MKNPKIKEKGPRIPPGDNPPGDNPTRGGPGAASPQELHPRESAHGVSPFYGEFDFDIPRFDLYKKIIVKQNQGLRDAVWGPLLR